MFDLKMKRNLVIGLHLEGKSNIEIRRALPKLGLKEQFAHRTIKRYEDTGSIKKRYGGGRKCTATAQANVKMVRHRLTKNPERSARQMAKELHIGDRSVRRILVEKLKLWPSKKAISQELHAEQSLEANSAECHSSTVQLVSEASLPRREGQGRVYAKRMKHK